jgi:hypothetical protein
MAVFYKQNDSRSKLLTSNYKYSIRLPFPDEDQTDQDKFIFRIIFKPESGQLWGFNKFYMKKELFHAVNQQDILNQNPESLAQQNVALQQENPGLLNNSRESDELNELQITQGHIVSQPNDRTLENIADNKILNTSAFMHSRLGLLDNQVTINYDLAMPDEKGQEVEKKKSRLDMFAEQRNFKNLTQEQIDKDIEWENDVDLDETMWMVIRNKKSANNILKRFETRNQIHHVKVNDIIKFGRVNFKVSVIKSSNLKKSIQGGYHLLEKKNKEIKDNLSKLYNEVKR